jgi:hypothetical protein
MAYTTINKPSEYFNTVTWTGNGSKITTGLRPDLIWYKARNVSGYGGVVNAIRGDDYYLQTYTTDAETYSSGLLVSDSTGFTPSSIFTTNSYVAWNWLANGAGVSNTDGSIASTVSANTTSGFSIVQYTGDGSGASATIGHGLGVTPACVIMKPLNYGGAWWIAHKTMPTNYLLEFNNNPQANILTSFGGGGLSFSAFTNNVIGGIANTSADLWNKSSEPYIAYCFAEKKGYSKFGSYTGNGNADGVFCYTGMKPAFVMIKTTGSIASNWQIFDNRRPSYNPNDNIAANNDSTEDTASNKFIDIVSNGFKARKANVINESGEGYIYMAFAEQPLVGTNNIPATAR